MPNPVAVLRERLQAAIESVLGADYAGSDPVLRRSQQAAFGDFQANAAMALGKKAGRQPRELAAQIVESLDVEGLCSKVEVAGPGFINLWLSETVLGEAAQSLLGDDRLGVPTVDHPDRVVIDYSSPTLTKEMHVGHIRSTVIGDAIARNLVFLGDAVIRQNHYGEWGTQFGMLIELLASQGKTGDEPLTIADLDDFYKEANALFTGDDTFKERARSRVVELQRGDPVSMALWRRFVDAAIDHANHVYGVLGVTLSSDDAKPESAFNDELDDVAAELERTGVARVDDGALCAFPDGFKNREGEPLAFMVRKSDGGYGYQATDLAAIRYRIRELGATRLIYVVDARQSQHLAMLFEVARDAGWIPEGTRVEHVQFGTILGPDNRPFKSRSGDNVKLREVLEEAIQRADAIIAEKNPELAADERASVAKAVGIGAVKYADLANDRVKDYVFDWDRMLAFEGNTAPYLQYAHARIRSIFRRAESEGIAAGSGEVAVIEEAERELVLQLLGFGEAVTSVADTLQPHRLCTYLFDLAQTFTSFYESCPVLRAADEDTRASRLALCELTARVLAQGLELLGIEAPDRM